MEKNSLNFFWLFEKEGFFEIFPYFFVSGLGRTAELWSNRVVLILRNKKDFFAEKSFFFLIFIWKKYIIWDFQVFESFRLFFIFYLFSEFCWVYFGFFEVLYLFLEFWFFFLFSIKVKQAGKHTNWAKRNNWVRFKISMSIKNLILVNILLIYFIWVKWLPWYINCFDRKKLIKRGLPSLTEIQINLKKRTTLCQCQWIFLFFSLLLN